ncbi:hypothetical protein CTEN210_12804 [Chaetoceros tenuissimus]|uniref:Phospholipid scramblase n=1 Tax=Chaetoceros tenuissimus TaxID=426638 RepID=A0AAD3HAV2_9STRA|nr:hypothetical protein CTEN210_12804 [Chaetoceros tenuissimus]
MTIRALGSLEEQCWLCVPRMIIKGANGEDIYKVHSPICFGGMYVNCCAVDVHRNELCGTCCFETPYFIYPASQREPANCMPGVGKIFNVPPRFGNKDQGHRVFFPVDATSEQKALIAGSALQNE